MFLVNSQFSQDINVTLPEEETVEVVEAFVAATLKLPKSEFEEGLLAALVLLVLNENI